MTKIVLTRSQADQSKDFPEEILEKFSRLGELTSLVQDSLIESLPKLPELPNFEASTFDQSISLKMEGLYSIDVSSFEKEKEEAYLRRLLMEHFEKQNEFNNNNQILQYDWKIGIIFFLGKKIRIPLNTNQEKICRVIFKNMANMKRLWSRDEIVEKWGDNPDMINWRVVYNAARELNKKVAIETKIKDLLTVKKVSVQVNPKYLQN
jgi:hypothetical protein